MKTLIAIMVVAAGGFFYSFTFPVTDNFRSGNWVPGPAFFPRVMTIVIFLASGVELAKLFIKKRQLVSESSAALEESAGEADCGKGSVFSDWGTQNAIIIIALLLLYPFLLEYIGFAILGFSTTFVIALRLKAGLLKSAVFSACAVLLTILFFQKVFSLQLPVGLWSPEF